jgi:hypothetical protein
MRYADSLQIPVVSADGKLAFILAETIDRRPYEFNGIKAVLLDIDTDSIVRSKVLMRAGLCFDSDCSKFPDPEERRRELNAELASRKWVYPSLCELDYPSPPDPAETGRNLPDDWWCIYAEINQTCTFGEFTATYLWPRLRVVDAKGTMVIDKLYPAWGPPGYSRCQAKNKPYIHKWGYDLIRRMMFVTLEYCWETEERSCQRDCKTPDEGCDKQPRVHHVFRLPPDRSGAGAVKAAPTPNRSTISAPRP